MIEGDGLDEMEYKNLLGAVSGVEALLAYAAPGVRPLYESFLSNAKSQLDFLKKKVEGSKEEQKRHDQQQAAIMQLAQKETALSQSEKETYSGFLEKNFFTKRDFKSLEQFYGGAWERLSEDGKQEMSHRVWEGIRRDEFRFTDLPKVVQEKEAKLAYQDLANPSVGAHGSLTRIPDADRADFLKAYRSGDRQEACLILERDSFRQKMALEAPTGTKHRTADAGKDADNQDVVSKTKNGSSEPNKAAVTPPDGTALAEINLDSVDLKSVQLVDSASVASTASLPDASGARVKTR